MTLEQVGQELGGLSRERVRQIEKKGLEILRSPEYIQKMKELAII